MKGKNAPARILNLRVQPRASRNEILGFRDGELRIRVTAAPVDGEANRLCRELLARALEISPSRVEILSGEKSRRKRVRVEGADELSWSKLETGRA